LAVRPDVVLGLGVVRERAPELVRGLEQGGASAYFPALARVEDVESMVREIGRRLGASQAADQLAERLRAATGLRAERGETSRGVERERSPRVFVYDCCDPPFTAARATVLSDLIERQGGRNVFADLDAGWTHVAWEEVVARKPELIVVDAYDDGRGSDVDAKLRTLRAVEGLGGLPVAIVPLRDTLGGLGIVHGAGILREAFGGRT
jgi:iron complex transport system substrate-binding protein